MRKITLYILLRIMLFRWLFIGLCVVLCFPNSSVWAQASLAAEDKIDEVPVIINGVKESFTVVGDARIPEQWYYIPDRPRLFERTVNGQKQPDFALVQYQFPDPKDPQALLEAGLLQFAASLAIPSEAITQLTDAISKKTNISKEKIKLAAMPMKEAKVTLYTPKEGQLIASAPQGAGIAPTFATQKMAFSIPLTKIGSDVYGELVKGNTGMPVMVEFSYNGLTPAAGFKVHVDWDQTYKFYSKDQKFAAHVSYKGLFGASLDVERQKIREELEKNKCIEIEIIEGSGFTSEQATKFMEPILNRINKELIEDLKPPAKIEPAEAATPTKGGTFGGIGYSVAIKDIEQVKKGTETISFNTRQHVERRTVASGFIGIGRYPESLRNKLVTIVPLGPWKSAFFVLPSVGDANELGINQVDLQIGLSHGGQMHQTQVVIWKPKEGWKDRNGKPRTVLAFGLMGLGADYSDLKNAKFVSKAKITLKREVLAFTQALDVFDGDAAITTPLAAIDVVSVDGSFLTWLKIDPKSDLMAVNVKLQSGDRTFSGKLRTRNIEGKHVEPIPVYWLIEKDSAPVIATIKFRLKGGKLIDWKHNGKDLIQTIASLEIELEDSDWQKEE